MNDNGVIKPSIEQLDLEENNQVSTAEEQLKALKPEKKKKKGFGGILLLILGIILGVCGLKGYEYYQENGNLNFFSQNKEVKDEAKKDDNTKKEDEKNTEDSNVIELSKKESTTISKEVSLGGKKVKIDFKFYVTDKTNGCMSMYAADVCPDEAFYYALKEDISVNGKKVVDGSVVKVNTENDKFKFKNSFEELDRKQDQTYNETEDYNESNDTEDAILLVENNYVILNDVENDNQYLGLYYNEKYSDNYFELVSIDGTILKKFNDNSANTALGLYVSKAELGDKVYYEVIDSKNDEAGIYEELDNNEKNEAYYLLYSSGRVDPKKDYIYYFDYKDDDTLAEYKYEIKGGTVEKKIIKDYKMYDKDDEPNPRVFVAGQD